MNKINKELIELCEKEYYDKPLIVPFGKIDENENVYMDFTNVSGLFIAGSTASGKSVFIDDIILSLIHKNKSSDIKLCLIDPKEIELNEYNGLNYVIGGKSEYDIVEIGNLLNSINQEINERTQKLVDNHSRNITGYNDSNNEKLPHIFVIVDEGEDILEYENIREILERILDVGDNVGVHLIFSTNAYLKDYVESKFLDRFKYRLSFDMASKEQSDLIGIKKAHWLSANGEAIIKSFNDKFYKFQAPFTSLETSKDVKPYIIK